MFPVFTLQTSPAKGNGERGVGAKGFRLSSWEEEQLGTFVGGEVGKRGAPRALSPLGRCRSLLLPLFFSLFFLWRRRRHLLSPSLWQLAPDHHRRARHPRLNSRLTIDCARSLPPPFLSSFSFSFLPENSSADLFCPWSSSISQKKTTPISAFNACSGRGKRLEQAEEGDAKGDVELAGGNIGFATPAAAGAPSSLPAPSSAKA